MLISVRLRSAFGVLAVTMLLPLAASALSAASSAAPTAPPVSSSPPPSEAATQRSTLGGSPVGSAVQSSPSVFIIPPGLEQPISDLAKALTRLADKKAAPEKLTTTVGELLSKLGALITAIVTGWGAYKASKKIPWFKEHRELIVTVVGAIFLVVLFYVLSGIVTSVLTVIVAILVLLVALVVASAHLLSFIDEKYPDARDGVLSWFSESTTSKSAQKLVRDNTRLMCDFLENLLFNMRTTGESELVLSGSLTEDFDTSVFRLVPSERLISHWQIIDDKIIVPVGTSLHLKNTDSGAMGEVVNVQMGMVVVRINDSLCFKKFSLDGFQRLGVAFVKHRANRMNALLERQQEIANLTESFNSQAL